MKPGKALSLGGYTAKFYKILKEELAYWLQIIVNNILERNEPTKSWQEAMISLIPKEESESHNIKDFRPISLLNVDYKILVKIILERLKEILHKHLGEDQARFLPGRYIRDNLRTVLMGTNSLAK